jgi:hypothetical protein
VVLHKAVAPLLDWAREFDSVARVNSITRNIDAPGKLIVADARAWNQVRREFKV